jgi:hypothetical protein
MYVLVTTDAGPKLFRNTVGSTGAPTSVWAEITGLSSTHTPESLFTAPDGTVYLGLISTATPRTYQVVKSSDHGLTFSIVPGIDKSTRSACFGGTNRILGRHVSKDNGLTWSFLEFASTAGSPVRFEDLACLVHPGDPEKVLMGATRGPYRTVRFITETPVIWGPAYTGLEGVSVYSVGQLPTKKERIIVGSNAGVATAENFTASSPSWRWHCPGEDCVGGRNATIDANNSARLYVGSGALYRGTVSSEGGVGWESFLSKPSDRHTFRAIRTSTSLPNTIVAGYYKVEGGVSDGGIYLYNASDGTTRSTALLGKPIRDVSIVSATHLFASLGSDEETSVTADTRGIYQSTDGGATWTEMTDSDLGEVALYNRFAYDATADILYVASGDPKDSPSIQSGKVMSLARASSGGTDWTPTSLTFPSADQTRLVFQALAVDSATGHLYVGAGRQIWVSTDRGVSWRLHSNGLLGDDTQVLFFDALLVGSSEGLKSVVVPPTPTPTPVATATPPPTGTATPVPTATPAPSCRIRAGCRIGRDLICAIKTQYAGPENPVRAQIQVRASARAKYRRARNFLANANVTTIVRFSIRRWEIFGRYRVAYTGCTTKEQKFALKR